MKRNYWADYAPELVNVAMGRVPADVVIRGGQWVNVYTREIIPNTDIAIKGGLIAYIGEDASYCIGNDTQIIEAEGKFMLPGLTDAHMHVESSMCTITEYVTCCSATWHDGDFC
jgi:adenine deaminase